MVRVYCLEHCMPLPLLLLGVTGATVVGVGVTANTYSLQNENLKPTIMGVDARGMGVGAGLVMLLLGGVFPVLGAVGMGLASASLVNADMTRRVKTGLEPVVKELAKRILAEQQGGVPEQPAPPQIPGPANPVADPNAANDQGGLWDALVDIFTPQKEAA